nr:unnamed protein product [Digitaria exilis]
MPRRRHTEGVCRRGKQRKLEKTAGGSIPRQITRSSSCDTEPPSVYLVVGHGATRPAYSVIKVNPFADGGGDDAPTPIPQHLARLEVKHGMSFVPVRSKHGPWIVGVGGNSPRDYGPETIVFDIKTKEVIPGPKLMSTKLCPVQLPVGSRIYALARSPAMKGEVNFVPWFEVLDISHAQVVDGHLVNCKWEQLPRPPFFPWELSPRQYLFPPQVIVKSYVAVDSHILLSITEQKGTHMFNVRTEEWAKLDDKDLPFIGGAIAHGALFLGLSKATSAVTAYKITVCANAASSSSMGEGCPSLSIVEFTVVTDLEAKEDHTQELVTMRTYKTEDQLSQDHLKHIPYIVISNKWKQNSRDSSSPRSSSVPPTAYLSPFCCSTSVLDALAEAGGGAELRSRGRENSEMPRTEMEVVYLDFLEPGPYRQVPHTLPRIRVWKGDMIKDYSELDRIQRHVYGKRPILSFQSTCYAPSAVGRTEIVDDFQKVVFERIPGNFSPRSLADITAIYTKHSTSASHDDRPELVKNIMVDLMEYFHQRAIQDNSSENVQPRNIGEASVSGGLSRGCQMNDGNDRDNDYDGNVPQVSSPFEEFHEDVHTASPGTIGAQVDRNVAPQVERSAAADVDKSGAPAVERSAAADVHSSAAAAVERSVAADVERSATSTLLQSVHGIGRHCDVPFQYTTTNATLPDNNNVAMSGDTEIIPSSGQGSETAPLDSNAETEIVNPASDGDDSNESSSQRNRTKVSTSQANVVHVDKVIINKKLKDRLSRVMESVPRVIPDNEPAEVEHQAATGEALGPSVFIQMFAALQRYVEVAFVVQIFID